jgi:hypothetical protein
MCNTATVVFRLDVSTLVFVAGDDAAVMLPRRNAEPFRWCARGRGGLQAGVAASLSDAIDAAVSVLVNA